MGIRFFCPHCDQHLNVKAHQAGQVGICPKCDHDLQVPLKSTAPSKAQLERQAGAKGERAKTNQSTIADGQKTVVGGSETEEFGSRVLGVPAPNFSEKKSATINAFADGEKTIASTKQPTMDQVESGNQGPSFLLDKPENPWLKPNAPDPIETGLKKVWYIRHARDGEKGPIKGKHIPQMLAKKEIHPNAYVWREDWEDWVRADMVFRELSDEAPDRGDRVFSDPTCPIPKGFERKANAAADQKTRQIILIVVAIIGGIATISVLGWLLASML